MNELLIQLQAILDKEMSKGNSNKFIEQIQNQINKLTIQAEIDPKLILAIKSHLDVFNGLIVIYRYESGRLKKQIEKIVSDYRNSKYKK